LRICDHFYFKNRDDLHRNMIHSILRNFIIKIILCIIKTQQNKFLPTENGSYVSVWTEVMKNVTFHVKIRKIRKDLKFKSPYIDTNATCQLDS
jgi:hypothetical protein